MNRRLLFKSAIGTIGFLLTPKILQASVDEVPVKKELTDKEKEDIIAKALETKEGRKRLREAMVEPLKITVEYDGRPYETIKNEIIRNHHIAMRKRKYHV